MKRALLPSEAAAIRHLLLIGLACHDQLAELRTEAEADAALGFPWPDDAVPVDRIGDTRIASKFALAVSLLEIEHG